MKKMCVLFAITAMLICSGIAASAAGNIGVVIDQVPVQFNDSTGYPFIDGNGRTLVPLRAVMEAYGLQVDYNNGEITLHDPKDRKQDNRVVTLRVGGNSCHVERTRAQAPLPKSYDIPLESPAIEFGGRTYVPARAVLESFDAGVVWDKYRNQVVVRFDGVEQPIEKPYVEPKTDKTNRARFGGTLDSVGLKVSFINVKYDDYYKSYIAEINIKNEGGAKELKRFKVCMFNVNTGELEFSDMIMTEYVPAGMTGVWNVKLPYYDSNEHEIEVLLP